MATTASVSLPAITATQSANTTLASSQPQKFLDHCIEELDPSAATPFEKQSTLWNVAASATLIAFTVLAVSAFIATGIFAPIYIPIAGICALLLLNPVSEFYEKFQQYSKDAGARAEQLKEIVRHYDTLKEATPEELQRAIQRTGVTWFQIPGMFQHPENLSTLKPLLARHKFWEGQTQKLEQKSQIALQKAQELSTTNSPENREEIYNLRTGALELQRQALESKVKDAFVLSVLRNPDLTGTLESVGDFSKLSNQERIIGNAVNDASVSALFTFKNTAFAALTADEVKQTSTADLSRRILVAASA
jgi:hypothetical protein